MAIRKIPVQFEYMCDIPECDNNHIQTNANGQYWEGIPEGWLKLRIIYNNVDAYDDDGYQRKGDDTMLLCSKCASDMAAIIDRITKLK